MDRINVCGTSCSGKTTLARAISGRLGLAHIELDALFWGRDWTPVPEEAFRARVIEAIAAERWVMCGGYAKIRDLTWARADTLVWLDYPMRTVLRRWARRTLARLRPARSSGRAPATANGWATS
jgi:adenylate kinase family enzyme